jgi:hypothetical protein
MVLPFPLAPLLVFSSFYIYVRGIQPFGQGVKVSFKEEDAKSM